MYTINENLQKKLKLTDKDFMIWAEMARRYKQFHWLEKMEDINLWGLFHWDYVQKQLNNGELITNMVKENKTIWVHPSKEAIDKYIIPLLNLDIDRLTELAGW